MSTKADRTIHNSLASGDRGPTAKASQVKSDFKVADIHRADEHTQTYLNNSIQSSTADDAVPIDKAPRC